MKCAQAFMSIGEGSTGTTMVSARRTSSFISEPCVRAGASMTSTSVSRGTARKPSSYAGDAGDLAADPRPHRQPVEAGALRIVVRQRHLVALAREVTSDVGGEGALAAAALGVHYHHVAHASLASPEC